MRNLVHPNKSLQLKCHHLINVITTFQIPYYNITNYRMKIMDYSEDDDDEGDPEIILDEVLEVPSGRSCNS